LNKLKELSMDRRNAIAAIAAPLATPIWAQAQGFPDRPIRLIVGYPPGGGSDNLARQLARLMSDRLKQPVIVDNRPGANTIIASQYVAGSKPDGYTLLHVDPSSLTLNQFLYHSLRFDPVTAFTPVAQTAWVRIGLLVPATSSLTSIRDLVSTAKIKPVTVASAGAGNITHLTMELFKRYTATNLSHIPYKGAATALQALMGSQVEAFFSDIPSAVEFVKAGRLKLLAVMAPSRLEEFPDVPTFSESGYPDFSVVAWFGVVGPAQMSPAVLARVSSTIIEAVSTPEMATWMKSQTLEPRPAGSEEFEKVIRADAEKYGKVVKDLGLKLD
jgi:tripartite-type tricarboxylate transporter receptor subunit TctC